MSNCTASPSEAASGPKGKTFSQCYDALLKNCDDETHSCDGSPWQELDSGSSRFRVWRAAVTGHKYLARFKVCGVFEAPPSALAEAAFIPAKRLMWDTASEALDVLKSFTPAMDLTRLVTRGATFVQRREFIDYQWRVRGQDGSFICLWKSLSPQECQEESSPATGQELSTATKGHTRGENYAGSGWVFSPGPEKGTTLFRGVLTSDLKGNVPKQLINRVTPGVLRKLCTDVEAIVLANNEAEREGIESVDQQTAAAAAA